MTEELKRLIMNTDEVNKTILMNFYSSYRTIENIKKQTNRRIGLTELLNEYEQKTYVTKNGVLSNREIIEFEWERMEKEYKNQIEKYLRQDSQQNFSLDENKKIRVKQQILVLVEYYMDQLKIFKEVSPSQLTKDDIAFIKKRIAYIEGLLNLKNGLYNDTYECFIDECERIKKIIPEDKKHLRK